MSGSDLNAGGIPGALTNQPPVPATAPIVANAGTTETNIADNANLTNLQKDSTVNYEVDRTIRHTVLPVGSIKRLSVAVVVNDSRTVTDEKGNSSPKPMTDAEKEQINNLVRDVMGFDQNRGDSLNVQIAAFVEHHEVVQELPLWKQTGMIELAKDLFKYALIAAVMLFVILRVIRPALNLLFAPSAFVAATDELPVAAEPAGALYPPPGSQYEQSLLAARQIAQQEPKIVASVVKEWVNSNG
jgi:flagellar M-ring protein FliF